MIREIAEHVFEFCAVSLFFITLTLCAGLYIGVVMP